MVVVWIEGKGVDVLVGKFLDVYWVYFLVFGMYRFLDVDFVNNVVGGGFVVWWWGWGGGLG